MRGDLLAADFVSLKVDAISQNLWKRINKPHNNLKLDATLDDIKQFAETFKGTLVIKTMLNYTY